MYGFMLEFLSLGSKISSHCHRETLIGYITAISPLQIHKKKTKMVFGMLDTVNKSHLSSGDPCLLIPVYLLFASGERTTGRPHLHGALPVSVVVQCRGYWT